MRATRANMDWAHAQSDFHLVMQPDDYDEGECSATSGDYWLNGMDDDLGGELYSKRTVWIKPEHMAEFSDLLQAWEESHQ